MLNNQKQEQKIAFTEEAYLATSEILRKYGLEESKKTAMEKIRQGKSARESVVIHTIKDFIQNKISETDMSSLFQRELETSMGTVKNLIADIKQKIIPLTEKIIIGKEKNVAPIKNIKSPIGIAEILEKNTDLSKKTGDKKFVTEIREIKKEALPQKQIKKDDFYREPIE